MANVIKSYLADEKHGDGFFPTPDSLAEKMLAKVDWKFVDSMLEPSAGKGDLAAHMVRKYGIHKNIWDPSERMKKADLDCVEIDANLRAILTSKGYRVVHDDFLTYSTMKQYSLIVMNPPFDHAAEHILKAISLLKPEGQLVALCNAETIRNPFTNVRNSLIRTLGERADIVYMTGEFQGAERKTDVEIAMISYRAPAVDLDDSLILERLRPAHKYVDMDAAQTAELTKADFVDAIIDRYNYEVETGVKLIREFKAVQNVVRGTGNSLIPSLSLSISGSNDSLSETAWVKAIRKKYWSMLFAAPQFVEQLTGNLRQALYNRVEEMKDYEFSHFNIMEIAAQMNAHVSEGVEKTIMELFDDWTRKYHWDENSQNRHYFDGWRTNDAFAVNKKVILPLRAYDTWRICPDEFRAYNVREKLEDIEKVMNYLDGGRTPEKPLREILEEVEKTGEAKKVDTKYFYITFYKKGTAHLEFKNLDLLARFNIFAARGKNWLPPAFGRKKYADMTPEEQKTVKSFMGDSKKYDAVVDHADFFLADVDGSLKLTA